MFSFLLLSFFKKGDAIQGAHFSREGRYLSISKYLKDSKLIEGSYKLDEKSSMLMANGTNKHAVLAFSTQPSVSLFTYLLEPVTTEEFLIHILQPNICILLKDSL